MLIVDDDRGTVSSLRSILEKSFPAAEMELCEAGSAEEGLRIVQDVRPDIVLSDIALPGIDGYELCRRIRGMNMHPAVVLMSDQDPESENAVRARDSGADAYLSKPVKQGELLFVVNFIFRVARLNQAIHEKNAQLEKSLEQLKNFHDRVSLLNDELRSDKRRLDQSLSEMRDLNAQLEEKNFQISSMMDEVKGRFESTVALLSNIIEMRQTRHRGHAERVSEISMDIARRMGLGAHQIDTIRIAARLHELGIVSLPDEERIEAMSEEHGPRGQSNHPLVGEMLLKHLPGFELVADTIRHLHENVDGTGIPDRLAGDRIPLGSRIISAASFFDHGMVSEEGMKAYVLLEHMERKSGTVFDEKVLGFLQEYVHSQDRYEDARTSECNVFSLKAGMELASDLYSESGVVLLRRGTVLDKDMLARVHKFNSVNPIAGSVRVKAG